VRLGRKGKLDLGSSISGLCDLIVLELRPIDADVRLAGVLIDLPAAVCYMCDPERFDLSTARLLSIT